MQTPQADPTQATRKGLLGLEQRVLARFRRLDLPVPTVVVGFSGGLDSLALAAVLGRIADPAGLRPLLAHVDHALRPDSASEQSRAAELAEALGLPFRAIRVPDDPAVLHPGVGIEEAARRERYRLLAAAVDAAGAVLVAVAHHQTDQAETVLLHLIRGAGTRGAAGMAERTTLTIPWWAAQPATTQTLTVWRPFLDEPRDLIRTYAGRLGLAPIDDTSNADRAFRRNAVRHEALPLLERIAPGATAALARHAGLAAEDDAALERIAGSMLALARTPEGDLVAAALVAAPAAIRRRVVRRWLWEHIGCGSPSADRTDAVLGLLEPGDSGRRIEVGAGVSVVATGRGLRVVAPAPDPNDQDERSER